MKYTAIITIILVTLFCSCERQGPMGPEGPQGPDGAPGAGSGAGNMTSFIKSPITQFTWEPEDGWGGYVVYVLKDGEENVSIELPPSLNEAVDKGMVLVYYSSVEYDWYRLPFVYEQNLEQIYDYVLDKENGYKVIVRAKTRRAAGESIEPYFKPGKIKVIVAGASEYTALRVGR